MQACLHGSGIRHTARERAKAYTSGGECRYALWDYSAMHGCPLHLLIVKRKVTLGTIYKRHAAGCEAGYLWDGRRRGGPRPHTGVGHAPLTQSPNEGDTLPDPHQGGKEVTHSTVTVRPTSPSRVTRGRLGVSHERPEGLPRCGPSSAVTSVLRS